VNRSLPYHLLDVKMRNIKTCWIMWMNGIVLSMTTKYAMMILWFALNFSYVKWIGLSCNDMRWTKIERNEWNQKELNEIKRTETVWTTSRNDKIVISYHW
jgi:hypothetical protein